MTAETEKPISKFTTSKAFKGCYELDEHIIRKLIDLTSTAVGKLSTIDLILSDGSKIEANNIDALLSDTMIERHAIKSIDISRWVAGEGPIQYANISIADSFSSGPIRIHISGRKDEVVALRSKIEDVLSGAHKGYSLLNYSGSIYYFFIAPITIFLASFVSMFYAFTSMPPSWFWNSQNIAISVFLGSTIVMSLSLFGIRNYLFPSISVRIGRGIRSGNNRSRILILLFGTILGGLVIGVAGNRATDWLFGH